MKTLLIYGATGKAGRLVLERALEQGWAVAAFVRNPEKVPEALRAKVTLIRGDLCDALAVSAAVRSSRPDAIVDASSALPFGHAKGQPANNADRSIFTKATVEALEAEGRLADCVLVIVGGQLLPEPGGTIEKWSVAAMAWVIRNVAARKAWAEAEAWLRWCFEGRRPRSASCTRASGRWWSSRHAARCARSPPRTTSSTAARPTATSPTRS